MSNTIGELHYNKHCSIETIHAPSNAPEFRVTPEDIRTDTLCAAKPPQPTTAAEVHCGQAIFTHLSREENRIYAPANFIARKEHLVRAHV